MQYAIYLQDDGQGGFFAQFRDLPEVFGADENLEKTMENSLDGLLTALEHYQDERRPFPLPSAEPLVEGEVWLAVPAMTALKIHLYNELLKQNVTKAEMARRLGCV